MWVGCSAFWMPFSALHPKQSRELPAMGTSINGNFQPWSLAVHTPPEAGHPVPVDSKHCPQLKKLLSAGLGLVCGVKGRGDPVSAGLGSFCRWWADQASSLCPLHHKYSCLTFSFSKHSLLARRHHNESKIGRLPFSRRRIVTLRCIPFICKARVFCFWFFSCLFYDNKNKIDIRAVLLSHNGPELQRSVQALVMYQACNTDGIPHLHIPVSALHSWALDDPVNWTVLMAGSPACGSVWYELASRSSLPAHF